MTYSETDFKKCLFNPLCAKLFSVYPVLQKLVVNKEALPNAEWERLIRYVIACYDPASPVIKDHQMLPRRKEVAATIAGYDIIKDAKRLKELFGCIDENFTVIANNYLKEYGDSRLWTMIVSSMELFWEFNLRIFTPIKEDKDKDLVAAVNMKSKMSEDLERIHERIERLTRKFYGDDDLQDASKKIRITAESVAGAL